jgi:heme exporter protein CcmD
MTGVFEFGEYAAYVWVTYGVSLTALGVLCVLTWRAYRAARKQADTMGEDPAT